MSRLLLVYPRFPETFWGFQRALRLLGHEASHPPLGLLTVAGLLPERHEVRLVDLNVEPATDEHWRWADLVLTGGMMIQRPSVEWVVERCRQAGVPVVVGGPDVTASDDDVHPHAHIVRGEAESPRLVAALEEMLTAEERILLDLRSETSEIDDSPLPRYDLLDRRAYASMALQMSRGCPFRCEFCDIPSLFGNRTRYKAVDKILAELDLLYDWGWRGSVFWVDDNFIGNKTTVKEILPHVRAWQERHGVPFQFYTQASVNLAGDPVLLDLMVQAGFDSVFLGIETPVEESLLETRKLQNLRVDLLEAVRTIQRAGLQVMAGFIIGFDNDPLDVDVHIIRFLRDAGIPTAMTGLMLPLPGSPLHRRLAAEGRLFDSADRAGDNTFQFGFAFETKQDPHALVEAYKRVLNETYGKPESYFRRVETLHNHLGDLPHSAPLTWNRIAAFLKSLVRIPWSSYGRAYGRFLLRTALRRPRRLPDAARHGIIGLHFHQVARERLAVHEVTSFVGAARERVREAFARGRQEGREVAAEVLAELQRRLRGIPRAVRAEVAALRRELELADELHAEPAETA